MKRTLFLLLLLLTLPTTMAQAQTAVTLDSLEIELWPDYDREAVLVLLTGTLPAGTPLPVTLTIPLPADADFNVVARITPENVMTDQGINPQFGEQAVTFSLSEQRFRVEYYQPYTTANSVRSFAFSWQSDSINVEQLRVTLQQPFAATDVTVVPPPANVTEGQDGLTYHVLTSQPVSQGESFTAEIGYTMSVPSLTVDFLAPSEEPVAPSNDELPFLDATPVEESGFDWQLLALGLGALILVGTAVWYMVSGRGSRQRRPARPKPQRKKRAAQKTAVPPAAAASAGVPPQKAKFCHQCGEPVMAGDKFCRNCGTAVKQK